MSMFENIFGKKNPVTPEVKPAPESFENERSNGSLDANLNDFTARMEKDESETVDQDHTF